jgi:16S rRNA (cytidine1402-2'-O)-methyltransferase
MAKLYIIPSHLGHPDKDQLFPIETELILNSLDAFVVENLKNARRFLRSAGFKGVFDDSTFFEMDKHQENLNWSKFLSPLNEGKNMGLISDAGYPGTADPGEEFIWEAHQAGHKIKPLIGPSSILLALAASGLNGEGFHFHGYVPIDKQEKSKFLSHREDELKRTGHTQIFMDTPYRNEQLLELILKECSPQTKLCVAVHLTHPDEKIISKPISKWKNGMLKMHKKPAMFLLG